MSIVNKPAAVKTGTGKGLTIERIYTTAGVHPYDTVKWERRDVVQTNWKSGEVIFEQESCLPLEAHSPSFLLPIECVGEFFHQPYWGG